MTPDIRPFLQRAIDHDPRRWAENTYDSCRFILQATLKLAGLEWLHVGKTADMDGTSVVPPGFLPFDTTLIRPDGQPQTVRIVGVSHDAAWHLPSGRQVKVIVNSAANSDPRPEIHGPAGIGGDVIDPSNYRWHNPPVAQFVGGTGTPNPPQVPTPPVSPMALPDRGEMMNAGQWLHRYYKSPEGLQRPDGLWKPETRESVAQPDWEGIGAWLFDVYLKARIEGKTATEAIQAVVTQIRHSDEWRSKHPGDTP